MRGFLVLHRVLVATLVLGVLTFTVAHGQTASTDTMRLALAKGAEAVKTGDQKRAVELLEPVFVKTPSYADSTHGPAAYWLGRALEGGDTDKARSVLRSGVLVMRARDRLSPRLVDAFIHRVFADQDETNYGLAEKMYRRMLRKLGREAAAKNSGERNVLAQNLRHLALILPDDVKQEAGLPSTIREIGPESVTSVDGPTLLTWWRGQDPVPATNVNERLRTHLRRVAHAREEYAHPERPQLGFDERGEIYVRLGPPDHTVEVNFDETRLTEMMTSPGGVMVNMSDFPKNEFWSYGDYDRRTYYIFVEKKEGDPFTTGTIEDMLPSQLQTGFTSGQGGTGLAMDPQKARGTDRTIKAMATLRTIYRQYAPFHPDMAARHDQVANKLSQFQTGMVAPHERAGETFAQKTRAETQNQDAIAEMRRKKHTPQQLGERREKTEPFDVAVRTARFLNEDGTTRTDVTWAPTAGAFLPGEEQKERLANNGHEELGDYLVRFTAVQKTPDYRNRAVGKEHIRIRGGDVTETGTIPARTFRTEQGDSTLYHLGLQWDQYLLDSEANEMGPKVKMATTQQDSLRPLRREESVLEMSDLKPMMMPEGRRALEAAKPYPFQAIYPSAPLALYFEVYHLPFNASDRTEYTVEYEIQGVKERGAIMEFVRGKNEEQTTVSTTHQGSSRKAEEYILLDLSKWEGGNDLSVTVRVTDETTGQEVERSVDFRLKSPSDE